MIVWAGVSLECITDLHAIANNTLTVMRYWNEIQRAILTPNAGIFIKHKHNLPGPRNDCCLVNSIQTGLTVNKYDFSGHYSTQGFLPTNI